MRNILAIVGIILGILLGLYVGVWVCLIGGIIGIAQAIQLMIDGIGVDVMLIAWSVIKIIFAGVAGYLSAFVLIIPSAQLLK